MQLEYIHAHLEVVNRVIEPAKSRQATRIDLTLVHHPCGVLPLLRQPALRLAHVQCARTRLLAMQLVVVDAAHVALVVLVEIVEDKVHIDWRAHVLFDAHLQLGHERSLIAACCTAADNKFKQSTVRSVCNARPLQAHLQVLTDAHNTTAVLAKYGPVHDARASVW